MTTESTAKPKGKAYLMRKCPSWKCQGAMRRFRRVAEVHEEDPFADLRDGLRDFTQGAEDLRLPNMEEFLPKGKPKRTELPLAFCMQCGTVLFVGPDPDKEEARIRAKNEKREKQKPEGEQWNASDPVGDLLDRVGKLGKKGRGFFGV